MKFTNFLRKSTGKNENIEPNSKKNTFFDSFQEFYTTSRTGSDSNRLNTRYLALIDNNKEIIKNSTILDLACHDGRWSFAALKNGAKRITGIEGRKHLVDYSLKNMSHYDIPKKEYDIITGDVFNEMKRIESNTFDIVFCFGFFYHTIHHMQLLQEIKRLSPKYLILDTRISTFTEPVILLREDDPKKDQNAIGEQPIIAGLPSKSGLELMLNNVGFSFEYYNWHDKGITDWKSIEDYRNHNRVSLVAKPKN